MASRIKGITIDIGGDTSSLQASLKGVDQQLKTTQSNLKDINKLLKLDPSNVELLRQKQKALEDAISATKERLDELKKVNKDSVTPEQWDAVQREIVATEQDLESLQNQLKEFGSVGAQQIKAAGEQMKGFGGKITEAANAMKPLSTAAGGLLVSLGGLGYKAITSADDLNTLSKQTGISTAELQKMQYASDLVDVSLDDITGALKKMKGNMDGHAESWERIGVSTMNADGSMRDATEVFKDVLKGLSQIENETERDQIAMDLFGKSADSLAGIIDDGGAALEEYGQKAEEMGMILSQDTLDSLNATNDTIDETKMALAGAFAQLGATVATVLVPLIQKASSLIQTIADKLGKLSPEQLKVIGTIAAVVAAIAPLLGVLGKVISTVGTIMTFAPKIVTALSAINPAVLAVIAVIGALVAAGVWLYNNWDLVIEWAGKLKDKVVAAWESVKAGISNAANAIKGAVDNMKSKVTAAWENVKSAATSVKDNVVNAFNNLRDKIGNVVSGITGKIDALKSMFDSAREHMRGVIDKIKNMFNFEWTIPKIKLPHLKITGKLDLFADPPKIPSVSIDWYRKAYDNPLMFTSPTVLPTASGLKGFGDGHGAEIVMGLDKLRELVGAQEAQPVIINVYPTEGMDVNQLAEKIQARFVALEQQRSLAYA